MAPGDDGSRSRHPRHGRGLNCREASVDHSIHDKRGYPIVDVREGYGAWVRTYEQTVPDEMDLRLTSVAPWILPFAMGAMVLWAPFAASYRLAMKQPDQAAPKKFSAAGCGSDSWMSRKTSALRV